MPWICVQPDVVRLSERETTSASPAFRPRQRKWPSRETLRLDRSLLWGGSRVGLDPGHVHVRAACPRTSPVTRSSGDRRKGPDPEAAAGPLPSDAPPRKVPTLAAIPWLATECRRERLKLRVLAHFTFLTLALPKLVTTAVMVAALILCSIFSRRRAARRPFRRALGSRLIRPGSGLRPIGEPFHFDPCARTLHRKFGRWWFPNRTVCPCRR